MTQIVVVKTYHLVVFFVDLVLKNYHLVAKPRKTATKWYVLMTTIIKNLDLVRYIDP